MNEKLLTVLGGIIAIIIGIWKHFGRKAQYRREQGEQAKKDLENAKKTGDPSDLIDAFDRVR